MNVAEAVASRRSIRAFLDTPVPLETVRRVLDQARMAPSGCNYQPWEAIVLTGAPLKALQDRLAASERDDPQEYDFSAPSAIGPKYHSRLQHLGGQLYGSMGIGRDQADHRKAFSDANMVSFGAPVLLLCHFPKAMKEAILLFCGIAIGHRDPDSPANNFERERVPLDDHITFEGF